MDDYAAEQIHIERLIIAAQSMRDTLNCVICFELFIEPVSIKCGHKFCRKCILRVASNDKAKCPCCNIKIQKRSIPREANQMLEECVKKFHVLVKSIKADSGIDVLQPFTKVQNGTENRVTNDAIKVKQKAVTSKSQESLDESCDLSTPKKINKLSLKKKSSDEKKLKKELVQIPQIEKVEKWLQNVSPTRDNFQDSNIDCEIKDTILSEKESIIESKIEKSNLDKSEGEPEENNMDISEWKAASSIKKVKEPTESKRNSNEFKNSKFMNLEKRVQAADMVAKRKKNNQMIPEKSLKVPCSVPAISHPDAQDWRRIKRVGKEMQAKTFKSLSVSYEKTPTSIVLDDTVPYHSTSNEESKNISKEIESSEAYITKRKYKKPNFSDNNSKEMGDKNPSENHVQEIDHLNISDKKDTFINKKEMNVSDGSHNLGLLKSNKMTAQHRQPDKICTNDSDDNSDDGSSTSQTKRIRSKISLSLKSSKNLKSQGSPAEREVVEAEEKCIKKSKLSLKPKSPKNEKPQSLPPLAESNQMEESEKKAEKISPVRQKIALNINIKDSEPNENTVKIKSPLTKEKVKNSVNNFGISKSSIVSFKKLGKICRQKKIVPFYFMGKVKYKNSNTYCQQTPNICTEMVDKAIQVNFTPVIANPHDSKDLDLQKNISPVNILSPRKEFFNIETPIQENSNSSNVSPKKNTAAQNQGQMNLPMEIEDAQVNVDVIQQLDCREVIKETPSEKNDCGEQKNYDNLQENESLKITNVLENSNHQQNIIEDMEVTCVDFNVNTNNNIITEAVSSKHHDIINSDKLKTSVKNTINKRVSKKSEQDSDSESSSSSSSSSSNSSTSTTSTHKKTKTVEDDVITISSKCSEKSDSSECTESRLKNKNKKTSVKSTTGSEISSSKSTNKLLKGKKTTSSTSSAKTTLSKKRSRSNSESSDDQIVSSILGKWISGDDKPKIKKQKLIRPIQNNKNSSNARIDTEICKTYDSGTTLTKEQEPIQIDKDSPIDEIIHKVKSFKENETCAKTINLAASSCELFEMNTMQSSIQVSSKDVNQKLETENSSVGSISPNRNKDENGSQHSSEFTMSEWLKFNNKSNLSDHSNGSNKENKKGKDLPSLISPTNKNPDIDLELNEIESSQVGKKDAQKSFLSQSHQLSESLMNITQEEINLKNIEKALLGNLSELKENAENIPLNKNLVPNKEQNKNTPEESEFETDNINATPDVRKKSPNFNFATPKPTIESVGFGFSQETNTPDPNICRIPAVTPVKNRLSIPKAHSTPVPESLVKKTTLEKSITFTCSGLPPEFMSQIQLFARKFNADFKSNYSSSVTHLVVKTEPETKIGQKTFKYVQGIGFKKYVVNIDWILDSLEMNKIADASDEKYEVLDPDSFESGSKIARNEDQNLYKDFTCYCLEPFTSFSLDEFKDLLVFNGAKVLNNLADLAEEKTRHKLILLEDENLTAERILELKKTRAIIISYEWVVDTISQYKIVPFPPYFCETEVEEALSFGIPADLLKEEDTMDEDEEEDLD